MRPKSSKGGKGSAAHLHIVTMQTSTLPDSVTTSNDRGWKPKTGLTLKSGPSSHDVWVDSQLRSILGTTYSEKTKTEWLAKHDIHTRRSLTVEGPAPSRFARALRAAWKAGGTILLGFGISGCAAPYPEKVYTAEGSMYRIYDAEYGVMCYSKQTSGPYDCVQVREGLRK